MEFSIPTLSELTLSHLAAIVAITAITGTVGVIASKLTNHIVTKLSGLISEKPSKYRKRAFSDMLATTISSLLLLGYILKNDQPASSIDVVVIVILVIVTIVMFVLMLFNFARHEVFKESEKIHGNG